MSTPKLCLNPPDVSPSNRKDGDGVKLDTKQRISAAAKFLKKIRHRQTGRAVEEACGVGMHMTDDEISTLIDQVFEVLPTQKDACLVSENFAW